MWRDKGKDVIDVRAVFADSFATYRRNFGRLMLMALILVAPLEAAGYLLGDSLIGFLVSWIWFVTTAWLIGASVRVVQKVEGGGAPEGGALSMIASVWSQLLWLTLLYVLTQFLTLLGIGLFVVPGVILALMWAVVMPSMVIEELGVFDSLSRSSDLTRGHRMNILWIGVFPLLIFAVTAVAGIAFHVYDGLSGSILSVIVECLTTPLVAIVAATLYYRLVAVKGPEPFKL